MSKVSYIKNKTEHKNKKRKDYKKLKTNIFKIVSWSSIPNNTKDYYKNLFAK